MKQRTGPVVLAIAFFGMATAFAVLLLGMFVEWRLGAGERAALDAGATRPDPYYSWSFTTSQGETIGRQGLLALAMHPFAVYANLPAQKTAYFTTDVRGFRGPAAPIAARKTVVVLGGSTAFGTGLARDEDTFASRLEAKLEAVDVVNAAVIGHLSGQELSYLVSDVVDLRPQLVIVVDGHNDLTDQISSWPRTTITAGVNNTFFVMEERMRQLHTLESGDLVERLGAALPRVFKHTARLLGVADPTSSWLDVKPAAARVAAGQPIAKEPVSLARIYAQNMLKMQIIAQAFGAEFFCVLQPDKRSLPGTPGPDRFARAYLAFRTEAKRLLAQNGVRHLDLNEAAGLTRNMFMDRVHLDARGNEVVATVLERAIEAHGLLGGG